MCNVGGGDRGGSICWQVLADQVLESASLPRKWRCALEAGAGGWITVSLELDFNLARLHLKQNKDSPKNGN